MADNGWMSAEEFGRSLRGFGINLLVRDVAEAVDFAERILQAERQYADNMFACLKRGETVWQYHADAAYKTHPLYGFVRDDKGDALEGRGIGAELRFYDLDPDAAVERAREHGYVVLAEAMDKPHGLREAYILDNDGYCWVVSVQKK